MQNQYSHVPVMNAEVLSILNPASNKVYLDATFGAGGYSQAILAAANCKVIALDEDISVKHFADQLHKKFPGKFEFININFKNLAELGFSNLDGIIFDIGVSSMQIDNPERGFSFLKEGPLDMRMDKSNTLTAKDIVNNYSEKDLRDIIFHFGGEKKSFKIAGAIVNARQTKKIETTLELAEIVKQAAGRYNDGIHPATRTFQAIRIVVNDEINALKEGLAAAANIVNIGGKIIVVTFHSVEDKVVKEYFQNLCGKIANPNRYSPQAKTENPKINFKYLIKGVKEPSIAEIKNNIRARSAKLRAVERIA